ncbi:hypothetical protein IX306_000933 [Porphyromonas levii]|uniref:DarT ssDNA thymidine ADP-ribosyltransferase family protein n=1 Tax=Porphyromonas levii TaxID=28114 RepID=UPI001B8B8574|nr:DarT ssDNA thymidine ADP-ribosyltransferase family protein [Porphyromonas levii]MBR8760574.1 hypothetical protein [Porphyromonas levii]MBR8766572.1 hypothetical protein [Porphyromonas levii]MBR8773819.1 hypothetical protein [Porphyromonas levii]
MNKRSNWKEFEDILDNHGITKLYHFTDRDNLASIIQNGGLYSWRDCEEKNVPIAKPGGGGRGSLSWSLDMNKGLDRYVRLSFTQEHPMMYVAMNDGRISNPVLLEIDPEVIYDELTMYADRNATSNMVQYGGDLWHFKNIHFTSVKAKKHFDLPNEEQPFYQAEVLVKNFIPLKYITNIANFGIPIPSEPKKIQGKNAYTARITREHPSAFIFLVDQSISMRNITHFNGEDMTMSEAVSRIVNNQIDELVERCVRASETRHYFDIAVVGYGGEAYSGWNGALAGRGFVTPEEIRFNEYKKIKVEEQVRTRAGIKTVEVEKKQWMEARHDGNWTRMDKAFRHAEGLLNDWLGQHGTEDCYPPIIINITDGIYNGTTRDEMQQLANQLKSKFTNDGNVLLFNIHIVPGSAEAIMFPATMQEMRGNENGESLFEMSSLLPLNYNEQIRQLFQDRDKDIRYHAMGVNAGMEQLVKMMKIGTLSSAMVQHVL